MFEKATKKKAKLRMCLLGPAKSGKTKTSMLIAKHLGKRVAVIDTERGSASKYAGDVADFDVVELVTYQPAKYLAAMKAAADAGYNVLIVDSLSHAWAGVGGLLDQKDQKGGNSFDAWRTLTPQHNDLVDGILGWPGHIIVTMRTKMAYEVEKNAQGKVEVKKLGLAPVQREGMEYEFDVMADMDRDHTIHITDSRCEALDKVVIRKPNGAEIAKELLTWLDSGIEPPAPPKLPVDTIVELCLTGEVERAKDAARKVWKRLSPDEKERVTAAISDAEIAQREAVAEAHPDPNGTEAAGQ